ncbi:MAG TPA: AIR synthase-related protein, partial [Ktedonobacteraceae bacterium]
RIVVLGGRTGRDGIHGATFSSGEMSSEIKAQAGSAVQIGAPITEKKVADVIIQARDQQLYSAITDCGAGGFSSAIGEMGADTGAYVELEKAPLKYQGLAPWEIWLSEAQERMVLAVPPQHLEDLLAICAIEEVEASIIGTFTNSHRLIVTYSGQTVADLPMSFLHDGRPDRTLEAVWIKVFHARAQSSAPAGALDCALALKTLLKLPTIASKESVVRRYDHEVQGATVLKPLVGRAGNGPGDAAILQPIISDVGTRFIASASLPPSSSSVSPSASSLSASRAGIILSNGINPLYGQFDPYWMAMNAVDEALRNLTAVGGDIECAAILDNICWGNPTDPAQLGMLVRAVKGCHDAAVGFGVPFISGKDSLNNEYRANGQRLPVIPTLLISALGIIDDASQSVDMSLKQPGNLLYLVGQTRNELAGSHYVEITLDESVARVGASLRSLHSAPGTDPSPVISLHFAPGTDPSPVILSEAKNLSSAPGEILRFAQNDRRGGSELDIAVPHVNPATARITMNAVGKAIRAGLVQSCHDLSEGGLAVAAAEMALAGLLGLSIDIEQVPCEALNYQDELLATILLFSESASRFLVEVAPQQQEAFEAHMQVHSVRDIACLGSVTESGRFEVRSGERVLIDLSVDELQAAWKGEPA